VIHDQKNTVTDFTEFLLAIDSVKGKYIEKRIEETLDADTQKSGIYKPRSGKFNASAKFFDAAH